MVQQTKDFIGTNFSQRTSTWDRVVLGLMGAGSHVIGNGGNLPSDAGGWFGFVLAGLAGAGVARVLPTPQPMPPSQATPPRMN